MLLDEFGCFERFFRELCRPEKVDRWPCPTFPAVFDRACRCICLSGVNIREELVFANQPTLLPQNLLHRLPFRQFVNQLIQVAHFLHYRILNILHPIPANNPGNFRNIRI
jgi:hypothetical protein